MSPPFLLSRPTSMAMSGPQFVAGSPRSSIGIGVTGAGGSGWTAISTISSPATVRENPLDGLIRRLASTEAADHSSGLDGLRAPGTWPLSGRWRTVDVPYEAVFTPVEDIRLDGGVGLAERVDEGRGR